MRSLFLFYIFFASSFNVSAQFGRERLIEADILLKQQKKIADSTVILLIQTKEDAQTNDSIKVEIVYFLAQLACDTCLAYLVEHVDDRFDYGSGGSDVDQFNFTACWGLLLQLSEQENAKWRTLSAILFSLKIKPRDDNFYGFIIPVALRITSKAAIRSIIEDKLSKNSTKRNKVYTKNLTQFLENLSK